MKRSIRQLLGSIGLICTILALQSCQLNGLHEQPKFTAEQTACWFKSKALQDATATRVTTKQEQHYTLLNLDALMLETRAVNEHSGQFCQNLRRRPVTVYFNLSQHPTPVTQVHAKQLIYGYVEQRKQDHPHLSFELVRIR